jgi:hypothetical protein
MSFVDFIRALAAPAALGVISTYAMQVVKYLWPGVQERLAVVVSVFMAAAVSALATLLLPKMAGLPAQIEQFWPILAWAASQFWYQVIVKPRGTR